MDPKEDQTARWMDCANAFANARGRPAVFMLLSEQMSRKHVHQLRSELSEHKFDELDLVIQSYGGDIHAAYQLAVLLRLHADRVFACVPSYAISAATLLCVGADRIVLDEVAQLGPLDAQVVERREGGEIRFTSALNPFNTLERLQYFALETLDLATKMMTRRSRMRLGECLKHSTKFVQCTTRPLFSQLDPEKLGEYSRALAIAKGYGERLLRKSQQWNDSQRLAVIEQLVHRYPSHDYIIDYEELIGMGFDVSMFDASERSAVQELIDFGEENQQSIVRLVRPSATTESNDDNRKGVASSES